MLQPNCHFRQYVPLSSNLSGTYSVLPAETISPAGQSLFNELVDNASGRWLNFCYQAIG